MPSLAVLVAEEEGHDRVQVRVVGLDGDVAVRRRSQGEQRVRGRALG